MIAFARKHRIWCTSTRVGIENTGIALVESPEVHTNAYRVIAKKLKSPTAHVM